MVDTSNVVRAARAAFAETQEPKRKRQPVGEQPHDVAQELSEDWKHKLFATLTQKIDAAAFEGVVQPLLRESGLIQVEVTGRTGDGGIDGKGIARIHGLMSFRA